MAKLLSKIFRDSSKIESAELVETGLKSGAMTVSEIHPGEKGKVLGLVNAVIHHPTLSSHQFEFEIYDGTERLRVVYLGQKALTGIEPGVTVLLEGRVVREKAMKTMYNPKYTLVRESN